jgi:hypothetical protein
MSAPVSTPDEHTLREFLLGTLEPERVGPVEQWLSSDPSAPESLRGLQAGDLLTAVLADPLESETVPAPTVEHVVRSVLQSLATETPPFLGSAPTPAPQMQTSTSRLPARLGSYRVVREIGRGGMGIVLEAEDEELERRVAIKVMALERAKDPQAKARFLREAQAAAAIEHDNIVPIHHVGEDAGVPFIVMALLQGESLEARLKREERLPPEEVIRLGRQIAAGLAAAHVRGLVHRDIKPANIWLENVGRRSAVDAEQDPPRSGGLHSRIKILDFGLARAADGTDGLTAPGSIPGTPAYMAPEQVDGLPINARADLFSLGATLYQCATGRRAFEGTTLTALLRAVATHHPVPPHEINPLVPVPLSDLIMRLLAKAPADRPQSAQEVADALAALEERPTATDWRTAERRAPHRRRTTLLAAAAVAVVVLGALGGWLVTYPPWRGAAPEPALNGTPGLNLKDSSPLAPPRYRGRIDVQVERKDEDGGIHLLRLNQAGALPLRKDDRFRIKGDVEPPAYLYVVWVEPGHDVTLVYPWDPTVEPERRPAIEERVSRVSLPPNADKFWRVINPKEGVATMVLFARPTPLEATDEEVRRWFMEMPDLPLPPGGEQAAVWFDDYVETSDPNRARTFGVVGSADAFARWQGQLQQVLSSQAAFQTAVSFARTGRK